MSNHSWKLTKYLLLKQQGYEYNWISLRESNIYLDVNEESKTLHIYVVKATIVSLVLSLIQENAEFSQLHATVDDDLISFRLLTADNTYKRFKVGGESIASICVILARFGIVSPIHSDTQLINSPMHITQSISLPDSLSAESILEKSITQNSAPSSATLCQTTSAMWYNLDELNDSEIHELICKNASVEVTRSIMSVMMKMD